MENLIEKSRQMPIPLSFLETAGGRIICTQCTARSKRTKERCRAPAMRERSVCRFHGGLSTGPKTTEGRARIAAAKTVHGRETRSIRLQRSKDSMELALLETLGHAIGLLTGPRTRGRKPRGA